MSPRRDELESPAVASDPLRPLVQDRARSTVVQFLLSPCTSNLAGSYLSQDLVSLYERTSVLTITPLARQFIGTVKNCI